MSERLVRGSPAAAFMARRHDDRLGRDGRGIEKADLHVLFGAEVREHAAFRHAGAGGEDADGDAFEAGLAHERDTLIKDALASRHEPEIARPVGRVNQALTIARTMGRMS